MKNDWVRPGERLDDLQRDGLKLIQNPARFCFGMDAVLLARFACVKKEDRVIDLCCGNGIIPVLMAGTCNAEHFTGLEIQEEAVDMARRSVSYNGLSDKVNIVTGDIKEASSIFGAASFDVVTCNPPYMTGSHGLVNPMEEKAVARHEILCTLDDVIREGTKLLKTGGHFFMVHRPFRLAEIMGEMLKYRLEPKRLRLVYPYVDREPNMVLIEGVRGGNSRITVEKPLIIYEKPGVYTREVYEIYEG